VVEPLSLFVPREFAGERIDVVLPRLAKGLTRSRARRCLEEGLVEVNGRPVKPSLRVKGGEELLVRAWEPEPISLVAQDLPLAVLYEDRDLLVLDKAAGMVVHPARGSPHSTLVNALLYRLAGEGVAGGRLGLVHRLDRGTSGCLVVAKNEAALASLQASFKARWRRPTSRCATACSSPRDASTPPMAVTPATGRATPRACRVNAGL